MFYCLFSCYGSYKTFPFRLFMKHMLDRVLSFNLGINVGVLYFRVWCYFIDFVMHFNSIC